MRSKKTKIVKELEPQEVEGVSPARIEHYLSLGYRPYLDEKSHVKWLTLAQMSMRGISNRNVRAHIPRRFFHKKPKSRYRKKRSRRTKFRFFREYWLFILVFIIIIIFLIFVFWYPDLLF